MKIPYKQFLVIYFAVLTFLCATPGAMAKPPFISAHSATLMDAGTGQVIFDKKGYTRREPASLTKIMTAILALEYGHPNEIATIDREPANIYVGQQINLERGDRITLNNLITAALLHSANDSTVAIAQHVAVTQERFIELMNAKALVLGALDTRYANTNGYHHPNHYTTAYDLARITRYALTNKKFSQIVCLPRATIKWADSKRERIVENTNGLVRNNSYEGICGVKTGTTIRAGNCLIAAARRGNRTLIAVVLHSRNRYQDAVNLLDYGFFQTTPVQLCGKSEVIDAARVSEGKRESVDAVSKENVTVYLSEEDLKNVTRKVIITGPLAAPVKPGQEVGTAVFLLRGHELARVGLVASHNVGRQGLLYKLRKLF